jgi:hypothetical protein
LTDTAACFLHAVMIAAAAGRAGACTAHMGLHTSTQSQQI